MLSDTERCELWYGYAVRHWTLWTVVWLCCQTLNAVSCGMVMLLDTDCSCGMVVLSVNTDVTHFKGTWFLCESAHENYVIGDILSRYTFTNMTSYIHLQIWRHWKILQLMELWRRNQGSTLNSSFLKYFLQWCWKTRPVTMALKLTFSVMVFNFFFYHTSRCVWFSANCKLRYMPICMQQAHHLLH